MLVRVYDNFNETTELNVLGYSVPSFSVVKELLREVDQLTHTLIYYQIIWATNLNPIEVIFYIDDFDDYLLVKLGI